MMKSFVFLFLSLFASQLVMGQVPIINKVTPIATFPQNKIVITGSGFSSTPANLRVSFDQVIVTPVASSDFSIEVIVPPQARLSNIEVINLTSGLSSKMLNKFVPVYSGGTFDENLFQLPTANVTSFSTNTEESFDVCSCDLDGDGKPDLASTKNSAISTTLLLLRNTSTPGNMSYVATNLILKTGVQSFNLACGDVNMDGKADLVVIRGGANRNEILVLRNTSTSGTISFAAPISLFIDVGQTAFRSVIRDMNLDGKPEIVLSNSFTPVPATGSNNIYIFSNQSTGGTLAFNPLATKLTVVGPNSSYGLDAQDLDGDNKPEIIINQFTANDIFIIKNLSSVGELAFSADVKKIPLTATLNHLTTADFNNDGKLDIAVTSSFDDFLYVILNSSATGSISFGTPIQLSTGDLPWGVDVSDIDGDKDIDIIVGNRGVSETTISVFKNDGAVAPTFSKVSITAGKKSRNIRVGDLDGDAKPDIAFTTDNGNSVDILRNKNCFTPVIINDAPLTICAGQTITLRSIPSPGATFAWKEGANAAFKTSTDPFADITSIGSYTVTATSEGGACIVSSAIINVTSSLGTVPADPTINPVPPVCLGQTLQLSTPTIAGATYEWAGPNSFTSTNQNPTRANMTAADAGIYTLQLQVSSPGTCKTNIASVRVDLANLANFFVSSSVASNTVCQGSTLDLLVNSSPGHTYQWIKDGVDISGQTSDKLVVSQEGVYKVRVTNTVLTCSIITSETTVRVFSIPVSTFTESASSICIDKDVIFTNASTTDNRGTVAYAWDFGDGTTSIVQSPIKKFNSAATRNVTLSVSYTGVAGCSTTSAPKSIVVGAPQTPVISATVNPICVGEASVLSVTGTFSTFSWTGPATGTASTLNITQPGTYIVTTLEANTCAATAQIVVGAKPAVKLDVTAANAPVASGQDVIVLAGIPLQLNASGADNYKWTPPEGLDNPSSATPIATPLVETTYSVTGSKTGSCDGVLSFTIKFDPAGNTFNPPNAFSPNGDGTNDLWVVPASQNFADCTISIFSKQGSKVFEQKGYNNTWDGTFEGKNLPQGTYYYVLTCPDKQPETGHVLLAR